MEDTNFFTGAYSGTDDLLIDFPYHNDIVLNDVFFDNVITNSTDSSTVSGHISSDSFSDSQLSGVDLCLPYDDLAEFEWLSNLKQESFSQNEFQNFQIFSASNNPLTTAKSSSGATSVFPQTTLTRNKINSQIFQTVVFVPCKTRSKLSRIARRTWSSQILHDKISEIKIKIKIKIKNKTQKTSSFICLHCGSDTTPQWRSGPMGPKTLCNACGVRFKLGRLVPEYRPASSPSYVSTKHSNSHRKVTEIRRQKELRKLGNGSSELLFD